MKMDNIIVVAWVVAGWLFVLSGCTRMPLYEATSRIVLQIDWNLDSLPKQDSLPQEIPCEQVQVLFYHRETHQLMFSFVLPAQGGELLLPPGMYDMVVYGLGTERTMIRAWKNHQQIEAFTHSAALPMVFDEQQVVYSPDHLFVGRMPGLEIPSMKQFDPSLTIRVEASTIVKVYDLAVAAWEGVENIARVEAYISGQARSNYFARPQLCAEPVTLYLDMPFAPNENGLITTFETFGKLPGVQSKVLLRLTIVNLDGSTQDHTYDITDEFDQNDHHLLITDTIVVKPPHMDEGLVPKPEVWEEDVIVIPIS